MTRTSFEMISHCGRGQGYPDNTVRASRAALQGRATGIMHDLWLTKDKKWVSITTSKFKERARQIERVHTTNYSAIRREVVPVEDLLALFASFGEDKLLYLDVHDRGEERSLVRSLERHDLLESAVLTAWSPIALQKFHALAPRLKLGLSYPFRKEAPSKVHKPMDRKGVELAYDKKEDFDSMHGLGRKYEENLSDLPLLPLYSIQVPVLLAFRKFIQGAHEKGIRVMVYKTRPALAGVVKKRGADGIISDAI
ncbi:hypothetical protein GOV11_01615 [Candidatus Woesearchaeota archaeon]|nr:hypothetical protein [Candidatus Woesearchaeota archaeon]